MVKKGFTKDDMIKYNNEILPLVQNLEPIYSIVARARSHRIKGGDDIVIDIHLTGTGIPDGNKLICLWSSPNVIDSSKEGDCVGCAGVYYEKIDGRDISFPIISGELFRVKLHENGVMLNLNNGNFLPAPVPPPPQRTQSDLPINVAETQTDGRYPISISLRTLSTAQPGYYSVDLVFTYKYGSIVKQAYDKVEFQITSRWDRNQGWIITAGSVIAFILLVLTVVLSIVA
ncbi:MAG: hypothetical protein WBH01_09815 [Dehalococcoidia bacterium]